MDDRRLIQRVAKPLVWAGALTPAALLLRMYLTDELGPNPIETITNWTGYTALVLLMVTLAVTPARRVTGWNSVIRLRRLTGLFAFCYVCLHFSTYVVLDLFFDFSLVVDDIIERPYITVGFTAFLLLIPLAATSTKKMIRRLGRKWQLLHRLIYVIAPLAVLHFYWKVKADTREPLIFAAIVGLLLVFRLPWIRARFARRPATRSELRTTAQPPAAA